MSLLSSFGPVLVLDSAPGKPKASDSAISTDVMSGFMHSLLNPCIIVAPQLRRQQFP